MNIYISGISGTGMGPLALMARKAGINVYGSDRNYGAIAPELEKAGIEYHVGPQDGVYLAEKIDSVGIDWFIYTSALTQDHPELVMARKRGLRVSKRDELIAKLVKDLDLKMVAVAGTHGKTTTTSMLVWAIRNLKDENGEMFLPSAYLVGTILPFAPSGSYKEGDRFFIYEADEYDRNFLQFHPWVSLITYVSFDHPDIYKSREDYEEAFRQFEGQSDNVVFATKEAAAHGLSVTSSTGKEPHTIEKIDERINLSGGARREDATTAFYALKNMLISVGKEIPDERIIEVLNAFPGARRRFEKVYEGFYSDYAHHPEEVKVTLEIAKEESAKIGKKGVVVVYQPHQNTRQHEVRDLYKDAFDSADKIYWLPTFLTREDESLPIITPQEFIEDINAKDRASVAELNDELAQKLKEHHSEGYLVIILTAGPADAWFRDSMK
ncbi:Mur ligase domain-containing protein [Butyrivibrio proteoclasticus]|uniref:Mur ligase domain-containing protein n=1 Tax=Butyrivibrio proteoclasticus TaxID=43305 RepID=UPI00047BD9E3|nr:Mur ligase domain-containing protein [Butyrivibrio proteoclasticus]